MFNGGRLGLAWRTGLLVLLASLASLALTGVTPAAGSTQATRVCGGLAADGTFALERVELGQEHACEHLADRAAADGSMVGMVGEVLHSRIAMAQAAAAAPATRPASVVGRWSAARNPGTTTIGISSVLLHTGKVLMFGQYSPDGTTAYIYDPVTRTGHEMPAPAPIFCSSVTPLADGRILVTGGADPIPRGIQDVWLFNPVTERWTQQPDTPLGRYYPTSTRLPDGRVLIAAGRETDGTTHNPTVEVYTPPAAGAAAGTLQVVGPEHVTGYYPHQLVMRNGNMLQVDGGLSYMLNTATWGWRQLGTLPQAYDPIAGGAAHLMLPGGPKASTKVMMIGGLSARRSDALTSTQLFDQAHAAEGWSLGSALPNPRAHMNVVQVPDGSAYGVGGNSFSQRGRPRRATLHYVPETGTWRTMAAQAPQRAYHSTAILLPDGRIMSAGDNGTTGGRELIDFYRPPYLFQGKRPVITAAPRRLAYRQSFRIKTTGSPTTRAVLMAPAATTHANDMNARHVTLAVKRTATGLQASAPASANLAPRGYYMLFALNAKGVPSVARWVHLG